MRNIFFPHYLSGEPFFLFKFHINSDLCNMETNQLDVTQKSLGLFKKKRMEAIPGDLPYA